MRLSPVLNAPSVCLQGPGATEWKDWRGCLYVLLLGGGACYYEWKSKGTAWSQRVKTWENFFGIILRIAFFFFFKDMWKTAPTDFSVRQVPALPSAFSFTSLSACSQPVPSSLYNPDSSISLALFSSLLFSTNQIGLTPSSSCAGTCSIATWKERNEIKGKCINFRYEHTNNEILHIECLGKHTDGLGTMWTLLVREDYIDFLFI